MWDKIKDNDASRCGMGAFFFPGWGCFFALVWENKEISLEIRVVYA
jgi:hypothetical protein